MKFTNQTNNSRIASISWQSVDHVYTMGENSYLTLQLHSYPWFKKKQLMAMWVEHQVL